MISIRQNGALRFPRLDELAASTMGFSFYRMNEDFGPSLASLAARGSVKVESRRVRDGR